MCIRSLDGLLVDGVSLFWFPVLGYPPEARFPSLRSGLCAPLTFSRADGGGVADLRLYSCDDALHPAIASERLEALFAAESRFSSASKGYVAPRLLGGLNLLNRK